jgi:hypothetical protein
MFSCFTIPNTMIMGSPSPLLPSWVMRIIPSAVLGHRQHSFCYLQWDPCYPTC